nr:hypothetical protein [Tanacetum cinerariifolium]
ARAAGWTDVGRGRYRADPRRGWPPARPVASANPGPRCPGGAQHLAHHRLQRRRHAAAAPRAAGLAAQLRAGGFAAAPDP